MILQAFLNSNKVKTKYIQRLEEHYIQDEIIKGTYWEDGKGCAIGCTIHSDSHNCYEIELGIPTWVARLEDVLFEGMSNADAKKFPLLFLESIPVGFDNWQHIYHQLCLHILEKECKNIDHPLVKQAICNIITLHRTEETNKKKWAHAAHAAHAAAIDITLGGAATRATAIDIARGAAVRSAAAYAARAAVRSAAAYTAAAAAHAAAHAAARSAAAYAAYAAARSAAAYTAAAAADAAAGAAEAAADTAYAARSTDAAVRSAAAHAATYKSIADKLLELLETEYENTR